MPYSTSLGIHYTEEGSGPPVVLVHGFALSHELWREQKPLADEFRLISYDARGCGRSDTPLDGYDYPELSRELLSLMDELGVEKGHLVGHSRGGGVLMHTVLSHPERVASLTFVSSVLRGFPWSEEFLNSMRRGMEVARERGLEAALQEVWLRSPIFDWVREHRPDVFAQVEKMAGEWSGADWLYDVSSARQDIPDIERMGEVDASTLVLSGQEELHDFVEIANMLAWWIPGAEQRSFLRVGHFCMLENAYETNLYLRAFLRKVTAGTGGE